MLKAVAVIGRQDPRNAPGRTALRFLASRQAADACFGLGQHAPP